MGLSLTNNHIHNLANLTKPQFKKALTDMMKAKGYVKATEDDASVSFSLVFTKDRKWVTILGEDINAAELAKSLGLQVLSVELVDSDFAELKLHSADGPADILMLGDPYMDEYPAAIPEKWQSILGENSWSQVDEIRSGDHTFAEDALAEFGALIGLGENILLENDDIPDGAEVMHFKKAKEKKLTLNAAFKQVFGPELEKQGFVRAKTKYPYYVRKVGEDIYHIVTVKSTHTSIRGYKNFDFIGGVTTLYRRDLDISQPIDYLSSFLRNNDSFTGYKYSIRDRMTHYNDDNIVQVFENMLEITKKYMLPILDKAVDYKSVFRYYLQYDYMWPILMDDSIELTDEFIKHYLDRFYTDPYLLFIGYDADFANEYMSEEIRAAEKELTECTKESDKPSLERILNINIEMGKIIPTLYSKVKNNPKLNKEIADIMEERKKINKAIMDMYV